MQSPADRPPPRYQFSTLRLLLLMVVASVSLAVMGALMRLKPHDPTTGTVADDRFPVVLMLVISPIAVLIVASLVASFFQTKK